MSGGGSNRFGIGTLPIQNVRMFSFFQPSESWVDRLLESHWESSRPYQEVGATLGEAPANYTLDHTRLRIGAGVGTFELVARALSKCRYFETGRTRLRPSEATVREGGVVCVVARHFGFYSLNPARIVRVLDEASHSPGYRRYGFVYGTLPEHSERGEERLPVELLPDGSVWYDLYSSARGSDVLVRLGYPALRLLQRRFARDSRWVVLRAVLKELHEPSG